MGPDDFGGSDEGSHYMSQERISPRPRIEIKVAGPNGSTITVVGDPSLHPGEWFATSDQPISPIQFAVGRPRDPDPPEHLELTLTSLTAAEELIEQLKVAARKLMLGQPKAVTIIQGRLVTNAKP